MASNIHPGAAMSDAAYINTPSPLAPSRFRRDLSGSTAYGGSGGDIDDTGFPSFDLDRDGYDNIQLPAPTKAITSARPALGSRLLSTLSNSPALTRSGSVLHSRARSLAALVPRLNTSTPEKERVPAPNRLFGDLFTGDSAPIRLGIPPSSPTKEKTEDEDFVMEYIPTFTERPVRPNGGPRRRSTAQTTTATPPTKAGGSWFARKPTIQSTTSRPADDILDININTALFPHGPTDSLSPSAYNDLLLNATALLQRMQIAYKEKVDYIASIQPEAEAQREEVEEAQTRSEHLKLQLEDMSRKANEQEMAMREMSEQLTLERLRAHEEGSKTVKPVRRETETSAEHEMPRRRNKRGSAGSASDSGFESDAEYADSITSGSGQNEDSPVSPPPTLIRMPTFDQLLRQPKKRPSVSRESTTTSVSSNGGKRLGSEGAAWATVERLRGENRDLRQQMAEMQGSLQGCIDFVATVKSV